MKLVYTYGGLVESAKDPLKLGRLKVRVPHVFGSTGSGSGFVSTNDLPWALPAGMPAGGSSSAGGFSHLPDVGDKVWVRFLDGEPEKPIWEWGMQSFDDADHLKLHSYKPGLDGSVGAPDRAFWTRYSHGIELNAGGIIESTSGGYRLLLNDSTDPFTFDGSIKLSTPLGNYLELDDLLETVTLNAMFDVNFQITNSFLGISFDFTWNTTAGDFTVNSGGAFNATTSEGINLNTALGISADALESISLTAATAFDITAGAAITIDAAAAVTLTSATDISLEAAAAITLNSSFLYLGAGATEPIVLGTQLLSFLTAFYTDYIAHTHAGVSSGTAVSAVPSTVLQPPTATMLSPTISCR